MTVATEKLGESALELHVDGKLRAEDYAQFIPMLEDSIRDNGRINLHGQRYFVGKAFCGDPVGLRQVGDSLFDVYYCHQRIVQIFGSIRRRHDDDLLVEIADLEGWTPAALWEDLKFDVRHYRDIARLALVGRDDSQKWMATLSRPFTGAEVRYFSHDELTAARDWVMH